MVSDVIVTIESVVTGNIVIVSSFSCTGLSVVDKLGSKVEIASVIISTILDVVVSTGSSVPNVVIASLPRGSGYMNSSSTGTVVSNPSVTRESESGKPTEGSVWVKISGVVFVDMSVVSTMVVFSVIIMDGPVVCRVVAGSVVSVRIVVSTSVGPVVPITSGVEVSLGDVVVAADIVGTASVEVPVVSIRIVVSTSVGPVVVIT